jgi:hypothetical protein
LCGLLGTTAAIARAEWRALPTALASRGLAVVPGSVHWLDPPGLSARRALLLARQGDAPADLYVATARTGSDDRVVSLRDVSNLTRSPNAAEDALVVAGRYAAFATRVADDFVAFTVVDTLTEHGTPARDRGTRFRAAVTRLQQTGQLAGYGIVRFDLRRPVRALRLAFQGETLTALADAQTIRVDAAASRVSEGEALVREHPRIASQTDSWVTWTVDTVRAVPWVGTVPISWAEGLLFRARHVVAQARRSVVHTDDTQATQREVAEDLADVLAVRASGPLEGPVANWPPAPIAPMVRPAVAHEGEWSPAAGDDDPFVRTTRGAPVPMYVTFVRSDRERADTRTYVVVWDPRQVELHVAPGSQEPIGATGETGSGAIPRDEGTMNRLVAGFNGAFQGLHGEYGVYAEDMLLLPPKPYAATVALMADGGIGFGSWPPDQNTVPDNMIELRQNMTALVDQGVYNPWRRGDWGAVLNAPADMRTARSGLCMTREGYVAYLWGDDLAPRALGDAMLAARCTYGVHLDMNGPNTGFEFYRAGRAGTLPALRGRLRAGDEVEGTVEGMTGFAFRGRKLVHSMPHHAPRYILRNPRDFFYLLLRPVLPGNALTPPIQPALPGEGSWHVAGFGEQAFPWPMARTRIRPDPAQPDRSVNLVRLDARRLALAAPDASQGVVARVMGAQMASAREQLRISMSQGTAGPRWTIGTEGDGIAGEALGPGMSVLRGACVDRDGFLVLAVADRAVPDLVARALDLAGCGPDGRISPTGAVLALPNGSTAAGEAVPQGAQPVVALVSREFPLAQQIFPQVTPVAPAVWYPVQSRRVRYFPNPGNNVTVQVRLVGQRPVVLRLPGVGSQFLRTAYPDGGMPPEYIPEEHR